MTFVCFIWLFVVVTGVRNVHLLMERDGPMSDRPVGARSSDGDGDLASDEEV